MGTFAPGRADYPRQQLEHVSACLECRRRDRPPAIGGCAIACIRRGRCAQVRSNTVPVVQLGYFRHFGDGAWLWGTRLSYSYLGTTSSLPNLVIPQFGSKTNPNVSSFSGYSVTGSYSVSVYHQTSFMPFVGRSFDNSFVYAGA